MDKKIDMYIYPFSMPLILLKFPEEILKAWRKTFKIYTQDASGN